MALTKPLRPLAEARRLWTADLDTGYLWWNLQIGSRCRMDKPAGLVHSDTGYVYVTAYGKKELVHRLIWLFGTGEDPGVDTEIDHINGIRHHNMMANLRLATRGQNCHNSQGMPTRLCSAKGIDISMSKFRARIRHNGINHQKRFATEAEAIAWRQTMELKLYGNFSVLRRS